MGKSLHSAKEIVRERSDGLCERCGRGLTRNHNGVPDSDTARSIHHRQPQRCGGRDSVINLVNLCIACHRDIHDDEKKAALEGWIVVEGRNPGNVPFLSWRGWVLPGHQGELSLLDFEAGRATVLSPRVGIEPRRKRVPTRYRHRRSVKRARVGA